MKDFFVRKYRGHQFEFTRVSSSGSDAWYHILVHLNNADIKFRMHNNKAGDWKITAERLPSMLYSLEMEFAELILLNEKPTTPGVIR